MARSCSAGSVRNYLKGLKSFYSCLGVAVPWAQFEHLRRLLAGLKRLRGEGTRRKLPITPQLLLRFAQVLPAGSRWLATYVCCVVGVFGLLRRSNLVVGAVSLVWPGQASHSRRCAGGPCALCPVPVCALQQDAEVPGQGA